MMLCMNPVIVPLTMRSGRAGFRRGDSVRLISGVGVLQRVTPEVQVTSLAPMTRPESRLVGVRANHITVELRVLA